jgi:hypothetical protein
LSGPVAQLGARFHGMEEVKGSNPFRSTKINLLSVIVCGRIPLTVLRYGSSARTRLWAHQQQVLNHGRPSLP